MFCSYCGVRNQDDVQTCSSCGRALGVGVSAAQGPSVPPPPMTPYPVAPNGPPQQVVPSETSGKAIASLIFGFFSFFFPSAIVAIVLGHLSLSNIKQSAGRLKGEGMATAGLVLGYIGVAAIPMILIVAAIAIPNLLRSRIAANEASAVGSIRTINTAEAAFASTYPSAGYACNLPQLGTRGEPSVEHAAYIDSRLSAGTKNGYRFTLTCGGGAPTYSVVASPITPNTTGMRVFCSDESGVIRYEAGGSAESCSSSSRPLE